MEAGGNGGVGVPFYAAYRRGDEIEVDASPVLGQVLGYRGDDPQLLTKTIHPDDRARVFSEFEHSLNTGEARQVELRLVARDGTIQRWRDAAAVVEGARRGALLPIGDAEAELLELKREKRFFESLVEINPIAVVIIDLKGIVTMWNPAAVRTFGYAAEEALGHHTSTTSSPTTRASAPKPWPTPRTRPGAVSSKV